MYYSNSKQINSLIHVGQVSRLIKVEPELDNVIMLIETEAVSICTLLSGMYVC